MNLIELKAIKQSFGKHQVLNGIDLEVSAGEIVGLIGPSGAGKSTVIKIALGMEKATSGEALVFSKSMPNRRLLSHIGYMAQSDALYISLTGRENLKFFADMKGIYGTNQAKEIQRVIKVVALDNNLDNRVSDYSGGMMRRLSLAIALLDSPQLLVLDEPTVGIDPALRLKIWNELRALVHKGTGVLITTHVMDEAEKVNKVALLLDGRVKDFDTPEQLKTKYHVNSVENAFLKAEGDLNE